MASLFKKLFREDCGNAFIEASIMLPVLVTLGFGALEFANVFGQHQEMTTGLRDAARYLARVPLTAPGQTCNAAIAAQAGTARNLAAYGTIAAGTQLRVPNWAPGNINVAIANVDNSACPPAYNGGPATLCIVTVWTSAPYTGFGFLAAIGVTAPTVNLTHSERWLGGSGVTPCQ
jgi:Flp pilus assembly protein TadG